MPTYDYRCKSCGHAFEVFHSMSEGPRRKCPDCGRLTLERLIGTGAAILFKGKGFYQTDYRSESYRKGEKAAEESSKPKDEAKKGGETSEPKPAKAETSDASSKDSKDSKSSKSSKKDDAKS